MPWYIIKEAPPGATLADAAGGFVISFPGTPMQMAVKLIAPTKIVIAKQDSTKRRGKPRKPRRK